MPAASDRPMRVCYFGTYRAEYSRNQMMIAGLRMNSVEVIECHETLWHGIEDRVRVVSGEWRKPAFWWRVISAYWQLIKRFFKVGEFDVMVVGYPGQFDVFLARILAWLRNKPLVWDIFMSIYLISIERELEKRNRFVVSLLKTVESIALELPDMLILDTMDYVEWFSKNNRTNPKRFRLVPTGADDRIFFPEKLDHKPSRNFTVLYSGTFIPNHGVMYIVEASKLLSNEPEIRFELIGEGPDLEKARVYAAQNQLNNITFFEWMDKDQLRQHMIQADVCLGAFGTTPQSMMTVQNKIYETMAMARPLISGDSHAVRQEFVHEEHIYLCKRADGQSLADAIKTLWKNPELRNRLALNGYQLYKEKYDLLSNGKRFSEYLFEVRR